MTVSLLLAVLMISNFFVAASNDLRKYIQFSALQGWLLAALLLAVHHHLHWYVLAMVAITALVKGWVIPRLLRRALDGQSVTRERSPYLGPTASVLVCAVGTGFSLLVSGMMPLPNSHAASLIVATALATVFNGFLLLVSRRKALTQVIGYLGLENGIFIFGMLVVEDAPLLVESAMLLDLVVGIFVMGIVINHIQNAFSSTDTSRLSNLKE
ncbi:MAG: hydrogenase [Spirochaetes bacterium]|nr:hydrogenase [Spirochaetota bacterium]